jgi:hypothetical protein
VLYFDFFETVCESIPQKKLRFYARKFRRPNVQVLGIATYRDFQELLKLEREAISRKTKKEEIFRNSGGGRAERRTVA